MSAYPSKIAQIRAMFEAGESREAIAKAVNSTVATVQDSLYQLRHRDPEFAAKYPATFNNSPPGVPDKPRGYTRTQEARAHADKNNPDVSPAERLDCVYMLLIASDKAAKGVWG